MIYFIITVNLETFILNKSINNLTWKYLMKSEFTEFRFAERDIPWLSDAFQLPHI